MKFKYGQSDKENKKSKHEGENEEREMEGKKEREREKQRDRQILRAQSSAAGDRGKAKTNLLLFIKILFAKHINRRVIFPN